MEELLLQTRQGKLKRDIFAASRVSREDESYDDKEGAIECGGYSAAALVDRMTDRFPLCLLYTSDAADE